MECQIFLFLHSFTLLFVNHHHHSHSFPSEEGAIDFFSSNLQSFTTVTASFREAEPIFCLSPSTILPHVSFGRHYSSFPQVAKLGQCMGSVDDPYAVCALSSATFVS